MSQNLLKQYNKEMNGIDDELVKKHRKKKK